MDKSEKIRMARYYAAHKFPYYSTGLFSMKMIKVDGLETMGVDKFWRCYYSEETIEKWGEKVTATVLIHELSHLLRKHHERISNREAMAWNHATDREINDDIKDLPFPFDFCLPHQISMEDGLTAEEYYREEKKKGKSEKESGESTFGGSCSDGIKREWEYNEAKDGGTPEEYEGIDGYMADCIIKETAKAIKSHSKEKGNVPIGMKIWADFQLAPPKVDYRKELKSRIASIIKRGYDDVTYSKINHRRNCGDLIFPSPYSRQPSIAVILDTSGSMNSEGNKVLSEVNAILKRFDDVKIISADCEIHNIQQVKSIESICALGGGGTSMRKAIEDVDKLKPNVILTITDGYTDWNVKRTRAKQITLLTENVGPAPFGRNIYI